MVPGCWLIVRGIPNQQPGTINQQRLSIGGPGLAEPRVIASLRSQPVLLLWAALNCSTSPPPLAAQHHGWQSPLKQVCPGAQAWPQAPQLLTSLLMSVSQPFARLLQWAKPELQTELQVPLLQTAVVLGALIVQTLPQAPQLLASLAVNTQVPLQTVWPATGQGLHTPATQ
jgi:hypothetical protein